MNIIKVLIGLLWIAWLVYWIISAVGAKRSIRGANWWLSIGIRVLIAVFVIFIFRLPLLHHVFRSVRSQGNGDMLIVSTGFVIFLLGLVLLIWARISLGTNWGQPMTMREKPELVTTGPYAIIRHPIYTGMIVAMVGTTIAITLVWLIPFVFITAYFIYSLHIEEKDMLRIFPKEYKSYKKRTKALIPFLY